MGEKFRYMQKKKSALISKDYFCLPKNWRVVRVVEGARLESVYTPKGYRGFESLTLRWKQYQNQKPANRCSAGFVNFTGFSNYSSENQIPVSNS